MKKRFLSLCLVLMIGLSAAFPVLAAEQTFADVPVSHWAYAQIEQAYGEGAIAGTSYDEKTGIRLFSPDKPLTMGQFAVILCRKFFPEEYEKAQKAASRSGSDAAQAVGTEYGLFDLADSTSHFSENICRYQMAQMITNLLSVLNVQMPTDTQLRTVHGEIGDWNLIPAEYQNAVVTVFYFKIISGTSRSGQFSGESNVTRAQGAVILARLSDVISSLKGSGSYLSLTNGTQVTQEHVQSLLEELRKRYPDGSHYDPYNPPYHSQAFGIGGIECAKLALMLSDEIFGNLPVHTHTDITKIRPGDVVESPGSAHWCLAIAPTKPAAGEEAGSYALWSVDGGSSGTVHWSDPDGRPSVNIHPDDGYTVYTRYLD